MLACKKLKWNKHSDHTIKIRCRPQYLHGRRTFIDREIRYIYNKTKDIILGYKNQITWRWEEECVK